MAIKRPRKGSLEEIAQKLKESEIKLPQQQTGGHVKMSDIKDMLKKREEEARRKRKLYKGTGYSPR